MSAPKIGKPYQQFGQWYYPKEEPDYSEIGIASWYGPGFHGKNTASGEEFDKNEMSAAHPTLPIPSIARVTNLENDRSVKVRINDRGPFAKGRIIDLSKQAAKELGFLNKGIAKVKIEYLPEDTAKLFPNAKSTVVVNQESKKRYEEVEDDKNIYIQVGAFSNREVAEEAASKLRSIGDAIINRTRSGKKTLYRLRLTGFESASKAGYLLKKVTSLGFKDAFLLAE